MYFGKLRYWLYNLPMSTATIAKVQAGANEIWWSKDPDLENPKRFRRFVGKMTAIGPKIRED